MPNIKHILYMMLFALLLGACSDYMTMASQSCRAGTNNIDCNGSIGSLHGTQRLDFYDEDSFTSIRGSNWDADITMSIAEGELVVEITNIDGETERFTITPENPLEASVAVDRSLTGKISAQLSAQGEGEETPSVQGITWEASFTGR